MNKHKIVILTGPGGVGKTTISQFLCQNLSEEFSKLNQIRHHTGAYRNSIYRY